MSGAMLMIHMEIVEFIHVLKIEDLSNFFVSFQLHRGDIMILLVPVINGIIGLILAFIACEIGQRTGNAFDKIDFTIKQFDWYLFPIEIKQMLPMIIAVAHQPVSLECFGSITCTKEVFKNVGICIIG